MSWSLKLITVRGIPIRAHASFLLILLWAAYVGLTGMSGGNGWLHGVAFMVTFTLLLFACVVLHELGHSLVAQLFGVRVQDITLWPVGGVARIVNMPQRPYQEFLITAAGPATNILLAACLGAVAFLWIGPEALLRSFTALGESQSLLGSLNGKTLLLLLALQNVLLVLFNLIPAFPMDGGRLLRSFLAAFVSFKTATRVASLVGQVLAVLLIVTSLLPGNGNLLLTFIGVFVFLSAWQERIQASATDSLRGLRVRHAMQPIGLQLHPQQTLQQAVSVVAASPQGAFLVVDAGRLAGIVTRRELLLAARKAGPDAPLSRLLPSALARLDPDIELTEAQERLQGGRAAVVVERGQAIGVLTAADLARVAEVADACPPAVPRE